MTPPTRANKKAPKIPKPTFSFSVELIINLLCKNYLIIIYPARTLCQDFFYFYHIFQSSPATQLNNLEKALASNGLTFTKNTEDLTITIEWNSTNDLVINHNGTTTAYVTCVEVVYETA